jgi:hypothetical protein
VCGRRACAPSAMDHAYALLSRLSCVCVCVCVPCRAKPLRWAERTLPPKLVASQFWTPRATRTMVCVLAHRPRLIWAARSSSLRLLQFWLAPSLHTLLSRKSRVVCACFPGTDLYFIYICLHDTTQCPT